MATVAEITAQLVEINAAITLALTGAPFDHEEGDLKTVKSRALQVLFAERKQLEDALTMVPGINVAQQDDEVGRFGQRSVVFRGDTGAT